MSDAVSDIAVASPTEPSSLRDTAVMRPHVAATAIPPSRTSAPISSTAPPIVSKLPPSDPRPRDDHNMTYDARRDPHKPGANPMRTSTPPTHAHKAGINPMKKPATAASPGPPAGPKTSSPQAGPTDQDERNAKRPPRPSRPSAVDAADNHAPPVGSSPVLHARLVAAERRPSTAHLTYASGSPHDASLPLAHPASMNEYREGCLKLEKTRHTRVYEAEKRLIYMQHAIQTAYANEVQAALEEHRINRRHAVIKSLAENASKIRRLEEMRYGITREDAAQSALARKHDMALRGRAGEEKVRVEEEVAFDPDKPRKSRKTENRHQKVKVNIELDEEEIATDLAGVRGEKRTLEPEAVPACQPERKAKKKK